MKAISKTKKSLFIEDIETAFDRASEDSPDRLKLALLLFLYGVLLGQHKKNKKIQMDFFHVVDSLTDFNKFCWGTIAFDFLVRDVLSNVSSPSEVSSNPQTDQQNRLNNSIELNGFIYAIQCWAFEAISSIGKYCGVKYQSEDDKVVIPRILQWDSTPFSTFKQLEGIAFNQYRLQHNSDVHPRLLTLDDEISSISYQSALKWESDNCCLLKGVEVDEEGGCQPPHEGRGMEDHESGPRANVDESGHETNPAANPSQDHVEQLALKVEGLQTIVHKLDERQNRIEATQSKILNMLSKVMNHLKMPVEVTTNQPKPSHKNDDHNDAYQGVSSTGVEEDQPTRNSPSTHQQYTDHFIATGSANVKGHPSDDGNIVSVEDYVLSSNPHAKGKDVEGFKMIEYMDLTHGTDENIAKAKRNRKPSYTIKSPYTNPENHKRKRRPPVRFNVLETSESDTNSQYDPLHVLSKENEKQVRDGLRDMGKKGAKIKIPLNYMKHVLVNAAWFESIRSPRGLLNNEHLTVLMGLVLLKVVPCTGQWLSDWTMVDFIFWDTMQRMYSLWLEYRSKKLSWDWNNVSPTIMQYVNDELPLERPEMSWSLARIVYGITHVNNNHWVLYQIDILARKVIVYDSMSRNEKSWQEDMKTKF